MGFEPAASVIFRSHPICEGEVARLYSISKSCSRDKPQKNLKHDKAFHNSLPAETTRLKNESSNS